MTVLDKGSIIMNRKKSNEKRLFTFRVTLKSIVKET